MGRALTLETIPMAAKSVMMDDPPELMKGRVRPMTGSTYRHMPTLKVIWLRSIPAMPMHT